jgi:hypothetical protein
MHPNVTESAQQHGRARREQREALLEIQQQGARERLAKAVAARGLETHPHFDRELGPERSLWINCRLDTRTADHQLVYALLDECGWRPDRERLSRVNHGYDIVRLKHASTAATLVVIIKLPAGAIEQWEAA